MVQAIRYGLVKAPHTLLPRMRVGSFLVASRCCLELACERIGVEPGESFELEEVTADRALAGTVHAGKDIENGARHQ